MRPDRGLGQHFLRDAEVLREIAAVADVAHSAGALEIGPGEGALTAYLVRGGKPVVALDKDPRAVEAVRRRLGPAVRVVEGDALTANLDDLMPRPGDDGRRPIVVGNLPYNAGSAIFRRLLSLGTRVERLVVMLQREVAVRIAAPPGSRSYGLLSVVTALSARAWVVLEVPPEAFHPRPKVHSAVVLAEPLDEPAVPAEEITAFTGFVAGLFQTRRKMLVNAKVTTDALAAAGVDPERRAESLTPEELWAMYRASLSGSAT